MKHLKQAFVPMLVVLLAVGLQQQSEAQSQPAGAVDEDEAVRCLLSDGSRDYAKMKQCGVVLDKRVRADLGRVQALRDGASRQKDILKLNCVNDKLVQAKAQANVFETAHGNLIESAAKEDQHSTLYLSIKVTTENVRTLRDEAEACSGEEIDFVGDAQVDVDIEGGVADDVNDATPGSPDLDIPTVASEDEPM